MIFEESFHVELKQMVNQDFKKEIVAFANSEGGEIFIGVSDSGIVVGVENADSVMQQITSMISDGIYPDLIPFISLEALEVDGKSVVRLSVSRGTLLPYYIKSKGLNPTGVYVRHGTSSIPASESRIRNLISEADDIPFDSQRSIVQNLTFSYAEEFFSKRNLSFTFENQMSLGLIDEAGLYTNGALLLSDQCPHTLKIAIFQDESKMIFKSRKEFSGSVLKQITDGYDFIDNVNNLHADFIGLNRVENRDYPEFSIREILVNSILHRDYSFSASTIVSIFPNRMEFVSLGGLPKNITKEEALGGVSVARNPIVADVFYRLGIIEAYGTGIPRVFKTYENEIQPEFKIGPNSFIVTLFNRHSSVSFESRMNVKHSAVMDSAVNLGRSGSEIDNKIAFVPISADVSSSDKVLAMINEKNEIKRKDVEELLGCSSFPARQILNSLLDSGKISSEGNARATKYVIRH